MSTEMIVALSVLAVAFIIRMPIARGMMLSSIIYLLLRGRDVSLVAEIFCSKMFNNFILLAVPLFIFAASIMNESKVTDKIFGFASTLVGRWRGGTGTCERCRFTDFFGNDGLGGCRCVGPGYYGDRNHEEGGL